jgi:Holliday junction resolvasome RuvABC endonuclease subunit
MSYLIVGVDPGTGSSSPTGFTVFNPETLELLYAANIWPKNKEVRYRIKEISEIISNTFAEIEERYTDKKIIVGIEYFVMRGKGGETLQRLVGSIMGRLPYHWDFLEPQNSTVKLQVAGSGKAEKIEVARGLLEIFNDNPRSLQYIKDWMAAGEYDLLDSLAIGWTAWLTSTNQLKRRTTLTRSRTTPK